MPRADPFSSNPKMDVATQQGARQVTGKNIFSTTEWTPVGHSLGQVVYSMHERRLSRSRSSSLNRIVVSFPFAKEGLGLF